MPARVTHNFSDEHALLERWHTAGKRYLSFTGSVLASEYDVTPTLKQLASALSPDDRFAVDLSELGVREPGKPVTVHAYVFKHCGVDDHAYFLGSLDEAEVDEIIGLLETSPFVVSYGATELVSTATRGGSVTKRRFNRKREIRQVSEDL